MRKNLPLTLIFLVVFVDLLGFGLLIPILPSFARNVLHAPDSAVGIVIAIYSFTQFIFNPILGSMSDKQGRRKIILITLLLNALGYIVFAFTHSLWMLILSRVIGGIGGSSIGVAQAYIADVTTKEERSKGMALIGVAFGFGFVIGPPLGGLLSGFGYEVTGFAAAGFSIAAFLLTFFYLPESRKVVEGVVEIAKRKLFDVSSFRKVFANTTLAVVVLLFFINTFSVANIYGTFALLGIEVYHFTDAQNGYIFGIMGVVSVIIQGALVARLTKKFTDTKLIVVSSVFVMFGLAFLPYGGNFTGVVLVTLLLAIGNGVLQPVLLTLVSKVAPEHEQGMVLGVNQSFSAFARMLGPLWGGFAFQYLGYSIPFLTGAFFTFVLFLFSVFFLSRHLTPSVKV